VAIGGGSDRVLLGPDEAYLDNVEATTATLLDWPPITDLDRDGFIGWGDIRILSENWLTDSYSEGDISNDGTVNFVDFADFARSW